MKFQSTRPVWGATVDAQHTIRQVIISIHAPRVGRDLVVPAVVRVMLISIHAPRVGRDSKYGPRFAKAQISIHAPRVGRDASTLTPVSTCRNFNPRAPCGARLSASHQSDAVGQFQSTRPVWGATAARRLSRSSQRYFNPRAPCGARRELIRHCGRLILFQSTRPVWGATANLTILPRQICTKGTKEFLLGRKTHGKKEK